MLSSVPCLSGYWRTGSKVGQARFPVQYLQLSAGRLAVGNNYWRVTLPPLRVKVLSLSRPSLAAQLPTLLETCILRQALQEHLLEINRYVQYVHSRGGWRE